jgi:hypothetical protein
MAVITLHFNMDEMTLEDLCDLEGMQTPGNFSAIAVRRILYHACPTEEHEAINQISLMELDTVMDQLIDAMVAYREDAVSKKTSGDSKTSSGE